MADPLPEGWTEEPVSPVAHEPLPDGWTEEPAPKPLDLVGTGDELAPLLSKQEIAAQQLSDRTLSDPYAGQRQRYEQQKADEEELVRSGFKAAKEPGLDPKMVDLQMAKHFEVPLGIVQANREGWLDAYAKSSGDPRKWIDENPLSAKLLLDHPELADHVVSNKELNAVLQGFYKVADFATDFLRPIGEAAAAKNLESAKLVGSHIEFPMGVPTSVPGPGAPYPTPEETAAARAVRDAPKPTVEVNDAEAQHIRDEGPLSVIAQRAKESRAQLEVSVLYHQLLRARSRGEDTVDLEAKIFTAEQDVPKALGETGLTQALSEAWGTSQSTIAVLKNVAKEGGTAALGAGLFGALVGGAASKSPAGAIAGFKTGAGMGWKAGAAYGAAEGSFVLESGDSYQQFLKMKTDSGEFLTEPEARGAAIIAGVIKTGVEMAELHVIVKAFGPAGKLLEGGTVNQVKELLATNPGFRVLAGRAAKAWVGEGVEEVAQEAVDEATGYLAASKHDQAWQKAAVFDPAKLLENGVMGLMGGAIFGAGGLVVATTQHSMAQSRLERGGLQAKELAKIASDPNAQALSGEIAQVIADKGAETGDEQTHVYVSAEGFKRLFQKDSEQKITELMGAEGPAKLAEALATGSKLPVPLEPYFSKWGKDGVASKLAEDTSATNGPSPREQKEIEVKNEEWAQKIAANEPGVSPTLARFNELEQTMVDLGKATKSEAAAAMKPLRSTFETFAKKFGQKAEDLFSNVRILLDDGTKELVLNHKPAEVSAALSTELHDTLTSDQRAERLYVDNVTDLHSFAGWEHQQAEAPAPSVVSITIPDIKPVNDSVLGGHDTSNALLRHLSPAVATVDATAGRKGTNFLLKGKGKELKAAIAGIKELLPRGMEVVGAVGKTTQEALDAMDKRVEELRAAKKLPARGETKANLKNLPAMEAGFRTKTSHRVKATPSMVSHVAGLSKDQFFKLTYQDKQVPGVLSHIAWELTKRKAWVASIDIKGLKEINALGKEVGDKLLKLFAEVVARYDGSDFDFAHLSGDEYAAQHDDPVKLQAWLDHVRAELAKHRITTNVTLDGKTVEVTRHAEFRSGVGAKTYGNADRVLNANKLEEKRREAEAAAGTGVEAGRVDRGPGAVREGLSGGPVLTGPGSTGPFHRRGAPGQSFVARKEVANQKSTRLAQFPTPEQSLKAMQDLAVFLDYVRERGAKPVDVAPNPANEKIANALGAALTELGIDPTGPIFRNPKIRAAFEDWQNETPGSRTWRAKADDFAARVAIDQRLQTDANNANFNAGSRLLLGDTEAAFAGVGDAARRAAKKEGGLAEVPPSKDIPGQASLEAYLNQVNASKTRLFQRDQTEAQAEALKNAAKIESAFREAGITPRRFLQPGDEEALGFTDIQRDGIDKVYRIALGKNANQSTFLHESAHVFLDLFGDLAARADAPGSVVADYETALKWLGVARTEDIEEEHHEKWARAFEHYLAEGKYPTEKLAGAFQRFRLWMGAVYKKLSSLGELNPEIRGVFDRLLATDREVEDTKAKMGLRALPRESLGMTGEEYQAHLDQLAVATSHATEQADYQVTKDRLRATEEWWKDALQKEKATADQAYEALPARRAQLILQGKPSGDWLGMKEPMSRTVVEAMVGKKDGAKFHLAADGFHPDEFATLLGYGTGKDMLEAVAKLPEKADWVSAKADAAMRAAYPGVLDERAQLRELVAKGLHGDSTKEWLLKEWAALQSRGTKAEPHLPPAQVVRRAAEIMAAGRQVGELGTSEALRAERQASNNAASAAAREDYAQAAVFKQQQLLNMYLHDALRKAKKETDQFLAKANQLAKLPARQRLGKASPIYREAVDQLLATFDLKYPEPGLTRDLDSVLSDVEKLMAEDQTPVGFDRARIIERASRRGLNSWTSLPVEDMRQVFAALKNIEAAARNRSTVMLDEKRADIEQVVAGLQSEATALEKRPFEPTPDAETFAQGLGRRWTAYDGALLKIETMARWLGGGKNTDEFLKSYWFRAIIQPMQNGKTRELDLAREFLQPLVDSYDAIPKETQSRQRELIDGRKLFPDHVDERLPQRRFEILQMLLNTGNQSNFDRLTKGRKITEEQVRAAAIEVGVTKAEYEWIQSIWDAAEKLKPLAFDIEEKTSGVRPEEIVAKPFDTPFGRFPGGYFPAVYDPITRVGQKQEADLVDFKSPGALRPSTQHNFLKARADDFSDLISLSPSSINRHLTLVTHDVAFREAVQSVGSLLMRDEVQATLRERLGTGRADQFLQWVADVAQMRGIEGMDKSGGLMKLAVALRSNLVSAVLGYKIPNALEDFTSNMLSAIPASDLKPKHLAAAIGEFGTSPIDTRAMVLKKSPELRSRQHQVARELVRQIKELTVSGPARIFHKGPLAWYKNHAFAFAEGVEVATATPIWLGAYRQALGAAKSETEAVNFADATIRQVLVSHNTVDLSALMRDKGPIGYLTMFFGAFNHFYNQFRDLGHRFSQADDLKTKASMAGRTLGLATGLFIVGSVARGQGPNPDEDLPEWLVRKMMLEGFLQMLPGANVLGTAASTLMQGKKVQPRNNSLFGIAESIGLSLKEIIDSDVDVEKRVNELLKALGSVTGVPTGAPVQSFGPLVNWVLDSNEWRNPFDAASDLTYGRKEGQGWNLLQGLGDAVAGEPRN